MAYLQGETKVYPDSEEGARQFIKEQTIFNPKDIEELRPDPAVAGVWLVLYKRNGNAAKMMGYKYERDQQPGSIIYMAGYPNPFGNIREVNDFEDGLFAS